MNFIVNLLILLPARIASHFSWAGPLIMRLIVGYTFMLTGWGKLTNLAQVTENFIGWGIPFPKILTPFVSGVECFGGVMLILGLFTRIPAAMLAVVMLVAIKSAKWGDVDSLETLLGFEEMTYFAAFMWLAIAGPGAASLDRLLVNAAGHQRRIDLSDAASPEVSQSRDIAQILSPDFAARVAVETPALPGAAMKLVRIAAFAIAALAAVPSLGIGWAEMERLGRRSVHPRRGRKAFRDPRSRGGVVPLVPRHGKDDLCEPAKCRNCWRRNICRSASTRTPTRISSSRYGDWGWPATIVFGPDGTEIAKIRGYIEPERMQDLLKAIIDDPSPGPSVGEAFEVKPSASAFLSKQARAELTKNFDESWDDKLGGWGENLKFIDADSMDLAITRAEAGDATAVKRARQTLDAAIALIDPVWGGVFQYSETGSWTHPHFEKIMSFQAQYLRQYSQAYALWKDPKYLAAARNIERYLADLSLKPRRRVLCQPGCRSRPRHRRAQILRAWRRRAPQARHAAHRQEYVCARKRLGDLGAIAPITTSPTIPRRSRWPSARRNG